LAGIKAISFNSKRTEITFQGGALISDVVNASYENSALVTTGTCNCVGALGAILGGGFGNLLGLYGFGVDNLLSLNVVTSFGTAITVSPTSHPDLWWAMRGAGPNFGIVTSAVMKSYPVGPSALTAWTGSLIFTGDQLEALIKALDQLVLQPEMSIAMFFVMSNNSPIILLTVFYYGTEEAGKAAYAPIYAVGPIVDGTSILPYNQWNTGGDPFCAKGGFKPSWGVGLAKLDPNTWLSVWTEWLAFAQLPGANNSAMILDIYSMAKPRTISDLSSAYPFRSTINFNAIATPWYTNSSLDAPAKAFGSNVRDLLRSTSGLCTNST
jgi:FAD/FMN-containing dehydrogenase